MPSRCRQCEQVQRSTALGQTFPLSWYVSRIHSTCHNCSTHLSVPVPLFLCRNSAAEGPFQSDALLVPEGCLFDHIHNASRCWPFVRWNQTGALACQDRGMQMRSFAMLLPCGISLFSGVEFVCCPKHFKGMLIGGTYKPS